MNSYLVGGAVRDQLLGLPVTEKDWLVTDVTPAELKNMGFQQVGKDFPVFLHPKTREEYSLPRSERNKPSSSPVTIEQDLARRDLTINAMAMDRSGNIIDPLGGQQDLENRLLRHTPAFGEDPIRVLRLARFAARYHFLGFKIAEETNALVRKMARRGILNRLVPERAFAEISKALAEDQPHIFIQELRNCHSLAPIIPELDRLFGVPQPEKYHPEIDSGIHTLQVLERAAELTQDPMIRYAALLHDLGKGTTPREEWPRHIAHEHRGVPLVDSVSRRLKAPGEWNRLAKNVARFHLECHRAMELRPKTILKMLERIDAFHQPHRLDAFTIACHADLRGRAGKETAPYPQAELLSRSRDAAMSINTSELAKGLSNGKEIAEKIHQARKKAIGKALPEIKQQLGPGSY